MAGGWNRVRAGLPLVMIEARGPGHLALSDDAPGRGGRPPAPAGQAMWVHEHRFLAATGNVGYTWQQSGHLDPDRLAATTPRPTTRSACTSTSSTPTGGPGLLLLHSPGNMFIRDLADGETICIQPERPGLQGPERRHAAAHRVPQRRRIVNWHRSYSYRQVWLRLWGPGRVAVQSVFERPEASNQITSHSPATTAAW